MLTLVGNLIFLSGDNLGSKFNCVEIWRRIRRAKIAKILLYSINRKTILFRSIRREDMRIFPLSDLKKTLLFPYLLSKLSKKIEIWYVNLAGSIDVLFRGFDFLDKLRRLTAKKCIFFGWVFLYLEFIPHITPLQI